MVELNKIHNLDCLEGLNFLSDNSVDLVVTSPPYDNLRTYSGGVDKTWGESVWKPIIKEMYRVMKDGGVVVWVVNDSTIKGSETGTSFRQALYFMECGFNLHDTMIWNKGSFSFPAKNTYHQVFDYMFVFSKGKPAHLNFIMDRKNKYVGVRGASGRKKDGTRNTGVSEVRNEYGKRFNIWNYSIGGGHESNGYDVSWHPAVFPEELAHDHIISWSNEGDTVLDPFMGSGTVAVECIRTNRNFIGFEINEEYVEKAESRIKSEMLSRN